MEINKNDIVESKAYEFIHRNLDSFKSTDVLISELENQLFKFIREKDKLNYLTVVSQCVQEESENTLRNVKTQVPVEPPKSIEK